MTRGGKHWSVCRHRSSVCAGTEVLSSNAVFGRLRTQAVRCLRGLRRFSACRHHACNAVRASVVPQVLPLEANHREVSAPTLALPLGRPWPRLRGTARAGRQMSGRQAPHSGHHTASQPELEDHAAGSVTSHARKPPRTRWWSASTAAEEGHHSHLQHSLLHASISTSWPCRSLLLCSCQSSAHLPARLEPRAYSSSSSGEPDHRRDGVLLVSSCRAPRHAARCDPDRPGRVPG